MWTILGKELMQLQAEIFDTLTQEERGTWLLSLLSLREYIVPIQVDNPSLVLEAHMIQNGWKLPLLPFPLLSLVPKEAAYMASPCSSCVDVQVESLFKQESRLPPKETRFQSYGLSRVDLSAKISVTPPVSIPNTPILNMRRKSVVKTLVHRKSLPLKGLQKDSKIKMLEIDEAQNLTLHQLDQQKKVEDDLKLEKEKKHLEVQARKDARELERENKIKLREQKEKEREEREREKERLEKEKEKERLEKEKERLDKERVEAKEREKLERLAKEESDRNAKRVKVDNSSLPEITKATQSRYDSFASLFNSDRDLESVSEWTQQTLDIVENANLVTQEDKFLIDQFFRGVYDAQEAERQISLNEALVSDDKGIRKRETLVFVMNYQAGTWRKVKRRQRVEMANRACKGYLVECKNPAVKGRLFCFTCAGRKSRNKKTMALETYEKECMTLRDRVTFLETELERWKRLALSLKTSKDSNSLNDEYDTKIGKDKLDVSGAAQALLSFSEPHWKESVKGSCSPHSNGTILEDDVESYKYLVSAFEWTPSLYESKMRNQSRKRSFSFDSEVDTITSDDFKKVRNSPVC